MTIADVLSDAVSNILDYLKDDRDYEESRQKIAEVVLAMDTLRDEFDSMPGWPRPTFPTDALVHLNALLAERANERLAERAT